MSAFIVGFYMCLCTWHDARTCTVHACSFYGKPDTLHACFTIHAWKVHETCTQHFEQTDNICMHHVCMDIQEPKSLATVLQKLPIDYCISKTGLDLGHQSAT